MTEILYTDSNNTVALTDVVDGITGDVIANADVTFRLLDKNGAEVVGQVWPLALIPTATPGSYAGTMDDTLDIDHNWTYQGVCTAVSDEGVTMSIKCEMLGQDRDCCE